MRLTSDELARVYAGGAEHVFAGSYGWASAGRFHHAQSQVHRFLNVLGGYVRSVNSYSAGAAEVILPHVIGQKDDVGRYGVRWPDVVDQAELVVSFGGMPMKNWQVDAGGMARHRVRGYVDAARRNGVRFVLFSPIRDDLPADVDAEWHPTRPGTDTAVMLALAHVLLAENRIDRALVGTLAAGLERFEAHVLGEVDGRPKSTRMGRRALPASRLRPFVTWPGRMAGRRTLVNVSQSIQRAERGEQPVWMAVALAAILGEIGLPGRGFSFGLGSMGTMGTERVQIPLPTFPQGTNRVAAFIPVARVSDMLLARGAGTSTTARRWFIPTSGWSTGPVATHSTISRISAG